MTQVSLESVRALGRAGLDAEYLRAATELAQVRPEDAATQAEAAYAHDRAGLEHQAIAFYDRAYGLGVTADQRRSFLVGYGSTLRNVGRIGEAVELLARARESDPDYAPFFAFLALALSDANQPQAALAMMLECAIKAARPEALDGYEAALDEYRARLITPDAR